MSRRVVLVDGGGTNIGSVRYALERLGVDAQLVTEAARIRDATHVILPGVGAAAPGMKRLRELGLVETLRTLRQPVLGVCLGMQLLFEGSTEGDVECLGVVPGRVQKMRPGDGERIPHMGWNRLRPEKASALTEGLEPDAHAYFVHSYAAPVGPWTVASSLYAGGFSAIVQKENYCGMQFHPERSAAVGARLLNNFLRL
ncbi:imidazole glycerol phosphate synthase subunit HisH [Tahibacter amnicola]|uniref:Imidazole glycerol phosphate synthase subunit HisH n=1 Tax=Tahibacter amnicola TaxID=2976241 RepID=A0ABY6BGW6_9GAMM|nr:imidazole glycerol phosphate synthase subunit HisH [Tahibacter amnicola]UXI67107.1 imidazole glycerol phosphate synthase subunit HisH [Tahibacter amnicola]